MRVLGIGDEPYEQLDENVKNSLHEYYNGWQSGKL